MQAESMRRGEFYDVRVLFSTFYYYDYYCLLLLWFSFSLFLAPSVSRLVEILEGNGGRLEGCGCRPDNRRDGGWGGGRLNTFVSLGIPLFPLKTKRF